jgi:surfeit locus 1 family protein
MIRPVPILATVVVAAAVAAMIALGIWQFGKSGDKTAMIEGYRNAAGKPPIAFPLFPADLPRAIFRRSSAQCLSVVGWTAEVGRTVKGQSGYRHIASCRTGMEGPGLLIDMGVSSDPSAKPRWTGGQVAGVIASEPDHNSLISRMLGRAQAPRPMLVADTPAPGLAASAKPSPEEVPNNHFSYGVQWFLFAAAALVIYGLALRKKWSEQQ